MKRESRLAPIRVKAYVNFMVNTWEILAEKERSSRKSEPVTSENRLSEDLLILDIVNVLEYDPQVSPDHLDTESTRHDITQHLQNIYRAQGIEISSEVIDAGLSAYQTGRFAHAPARKGLTVRLARLYVNRRKWLPLFFTLIFIFGAVAAINYVGFVRPQQIENQKIRTQLTRILPAQLSQGHELARSLAATEALKSRADNLLVLGQDAIAARDIGEAETIANELSRFADDLAQAFKLRVVSRPGEYSGVFRINEDGGREVRNYYLIVEGIGADGKPVNVLIHSEEDQMSLRTKIWGLRVPEAEFRRMAADKADDQIIQNAIIGEKKRGYIEPEFSIQTSGGNILDW